MDKQRFLDMMVDVLDTDQDLTMDTQLSNLDEWDSLAILSFMASADMKLKKRVNAAKVKVAATIGDLYALCTE